MHDRNGSQLFVGDTVIFKAKITELHSTEDYCNVQIESLYGRRPDGAKETVYAINTGVLVLDEVSPAKFEAPKDETAAASE